MWPMGIYNTTFYNGVVLRNAHPLLRGALMVTYLASYRSTPQIALAYGRLHMRVILTLPVGNQALRALISGASGWY